jgi:hypothetical protein
MMMMMIQLTVHSWTLNIRKYFPTYSVLGLQGLGGRYAISYYCCWWWHQIRNRCRDMRHPEASSHPFYLDTHIPCGCKIRDVPLSSLGCCPPWLSAIIHNIIYSHYQKLLGILACLHHLFNNEIKLNACKLCHQSR